MRGRDRILLAHGSGGRLTHQLVRELFVPALENPILSTLTDSAVLPELPPGRPALTTDAFVVDPPVFPGGDLGHLSICGTVNDLAASGAKPIWLTFGTILEEGASIKFVEQIASGAARAAHDAGVQVVAGDTKVVPKGKGDSLYIVTAGLGVVPPGLDLNDQRIEADDAILVTGPIGDHGATIMACRHNLSGAGLKSDCAPLASLAERLLESGAEIHAMHDPTRGGVAVTCHEVAERAGVRIVLEDEAIPVRPEVSTVCDLLGLDPLFVACEGRMLIWTKEHDVDTALEALRGHPDGREAARIGTVTERKEDEVPVALRTSFGSDRPLDLLSGIDLPRIC